MKRPVAPRHAPAETYDINLTVLKRSKNLHQIHIPASFVLYNPLRLNDVALDLLHAVMAGSRTDDSIMEIDTTNRLTFWVFLDAMGKEFIQELRSIFPRNFDNLVFVSLSIDPEYVNNPSYHCSDTDTCKQLTAYFEISNPLGGGIYPLNYLIVTDTHNLVRCKLPIRLGSRYGRHQSFGVDLDQLKGLVDEYLEFFMKSHIRIS